MRILPRDFISSFPNKIINIHPSLLPKFPGLHAQQQALKAGEEVSGCTVHLVNTYVDAGPIVSQVEVPVLEGDDEERLSSRILEQEHIVLPKTVEEISNGSICLEGDRVIKKDNN